MRLPAVARCQGIPHAEAVLSAAALAARAPPGSGPGSGGDHLRQQARVSHPIQSRTGRPKPQTIAVVRLVGPGQDLDVFRHRCPGPAEVSFSSRPRRPLLVRSPDSRPEGQCIPAHDGWRCTQPQGHRAHSNAGRAAPAPRAPARRGRRRLDRPRRLF